MPARSFEIASAEVPRILRNGALGQVVDRIKIRLTSQTRGSSLNMEWNGSRADAPAALQRVAQNGESAVAKMIAATPTP